MIIARLSTKRLAGFAVAILVALTAGTSSILPPPQAANAMPVIGRDLAAQLDDMSTGTDQMLAVSGDSAEARNALIPVSKARIETPGLFARYEMSATSMATAEKCLAQAIYYEAALEPEQGQRAVAQVVLNRVRHPAYPNTVCGVVYEGVERPVCQFSFTCDGSLLRAPSAAYWGRAKRIAHEMMNGDTEPSVGTATHYHADYVVPRWAYTLGKITQIGRHIFYRFPGRGGSTVSFGQRWSGREFVPQVDFDRLRIKLAAEEFEELAPEAEFVPGTTVVADVKDRHAATDVGGRLDTTKTWRLNIPDPVSLSASYKATLAGQGGATSEPVEPAGATE